MNDDGGYAFAGSGLQPAFYPTTYWGHETESEGSDGDGAPLPLPPSEPLPEDGDGQPGPASPPLAPPPLAPPPLAETPRLASWPPVPSTVRPLLAGRIVFRCWRVLVGLARSGRVYD